MGGPKNNQLLNATVHHPDLDFVYMTVRPDGVPI